MAKRLRQQIMGALAIAMALLWSLVALPKAMGQQPSVPANGFSQQDVPRDYWIVSSRHCPQTAGSLRRHHRLHYFHVLPNAALIQDGESEFNRWINPNIPVCIVVHGSFATWEDTRFDSDNMYKWIRSAAPQQPLQLVFFTWPSKGPFTLIPHIDMGILGRRSGLNGVYLAQLINRLPPKSRIVLLGHSHGARLVSSAVHLLAGGQVQGKRLAMQPNSATRIRMVLIAAAIDSHWLTPGERYGRVLYRAERLLNLRNSRDLALSLYPLRKPFSHQALARTGFQRRDLATMGALSGKLRELDVTPLVERGHFWHHYYDKPQIARSIAPLIYFMDDPAASRQQNHDSPQRKKQTATAKQRLRETFAVIKRVSSRTNR